MAEVTSGMDLTVIVLRYDEAEALGRVLHKYYWNEDDDNCEPLHELYDALGLPTFDIPTKENQ